MTGDIPQPSSGVKVKLLISGIAGVMALGALAGFLLIHLQRAERQRDVARPLGSQVVSAAIMLPVSDLKLSESFYRDKLGFEVLSEQRDIVLLRKTNLLLYLAPVSPPTPEKPDVVLAPPESRERLSQNLVLEVKDCQKAYEELRGRGVEFFTPPQRPPWGGWRCFTRDPDGYLIEIYEQKSSGSDVDLTPFL